MNILQSKIISKNYSAINYKSINLNNEIQLLLETSECNLILPTDYKLMAAEQAIEGLVDNNITADIDLYSALERQDWHEANLIYQRVFRPQLVAFANKIILKAITEQAA